MAGMGERKQTEYHFITSINKLTIISFVNSFHLQFNATINLLIISYFELHCQVKRLNYVKYSFLSKLIKKNYFLKDFFRFLFGCNIKKKFN